MQKQNRFNFSPTHMNLLQQFQILFNRQNLCSNNYLFRQMNQNLQIPINFIVQQRRIMQISNNIQIIEQTLQMCNLVKLIDQKTIKIIQYPTLKINNQYKTDIEEFYKIMKQKNKNILLYEQDNIFYLSLIDKKPVKQLQIQLNEFNKNIQYKVADLQSDWKIGTAKIRKLKEQTKRNIKNQKFSFEKSPAVFIRRAVQTSDQQQDNKTKKKNYPNKKQIEKQKEKKYREKPVINEEDFPTLS